jgi:hypothetical protein
MLGAKNCYVKNNCLKDNDAQPSEADIKVTRDLVRAGQSLKIEVFDHASLHFAN